MVQELPHGLLDVTSEPFCADSTGRTDCTAALQRAIDHARDHQLVVFFPAGDYRISDTLDCEHGRYDRQTQQWRPGDRAWPCVLRGSVKGRRPRIILAPHAPSFGDPDQPKRVVYFWSRPLSGRINNDATINMNQMLVGLDVVIGEGNAGAIGVSHLCAQGSGVQDCTIDATHGLCGLEGGAGSGSSHAGVTILGGRIGADLRIGQPASVLVGFTLRGQTEAALLYHGQQALSAVGCRFEQQAGPVAVVTGAAEPVPHHGQVCLTDCVIEFTDGGDHTAVQVNASTYLNHVYVRGATTLIHEKQGGRWTASPQQWTCIREYAWAQEDRQCVPKGATEPVSYQACIYVDGQRQVRFEPLLQGDAPPPVDLQERHLWNAATFPTWEDGDAVNVQIEPYGATGDGRTDDTAALQRAIDENRTVFLPKGDYAISRTLRLRPDTQLIGVHRCFARIKPITSPQGDFHDAAHPAPVVRTSDAPEAETVLHGWCIDLPLAAPGAFGLHWRCGVRSLFRDVDVDVEPNWDPKWEDRLTQSIEHPMRNHPAVVIDGGGAGRFYNFFQESWRWHGPDYRHLLIRDTCGPLWFYQCNPEHGRGDANMEVRHARYVTLFGVKCEGNDPAIIFRDCAHIRLIGYGGNASAMPGRALFVLENTEHVLLANLVDKPRFGFGFPEHFGGQGQDPARWVMVLDQARGNKTFQTRPFERPVLYKRGRPESQPRTPTQDVSP